MITDLRGEQSTSCVITDELLLICRNEMGSRY